MTNIECIRRHADFFKFLFFICFVAIGQQQQQYPRRLGIWFRHDFDFDQIKGRDRSSFYLIEIKIALWKNGNKNNN